LKAVTTAKLGYNPIELDSELMIPFIAFNPDIVGAFLAAMRWSNRRSLRSTLFLML
jgi:hypothetical protein